MMVQDGALEAAWARAWACVWPGAASVALSLDPPISSRKAELVSVQGFSGSLVAADRLYVRGRSMSLVVSGLSSAGVRVAGRLAAGGLWGRAGFEWCRGGGRRAPPGQRAGVLRGEGAGAVDQAVGDGQQLEADGAGPGEPLGGFRLRQGGGPADEIVGQDGALQPGGVGREVARGAVLQPGSFFEVPDGEFDAGGGLGGRRRFRPRRRRGRSRTRSDASRAAAGPGGHRSGGCGARSTVALVFGLGHLGLAAGRVGDLPPGRFVDAGDGLGHPLVLVRTAMVSRTLRRARVAMVSLDQNPESNRITISPRLRFPARRNRATTSSMNRRAPRAVFAEPLRMRACTISPLSARLARIG